jgi:dipeptidyl-peptidase-3
MMRVLLLADGFMNLDVDFETHQITVTIDQSKLLSRAKQSLRQLLLKIHICRCTAVVDAARTFFGGLTEVNEYWLKIRDIVATHKPRKEVFVQANTYEEDGDVGIKEYELSAEGCIQSWTERCELLDL